MKVAWLEKGEPGMKFVRVFARAATDLQKKLASLRREIAADGVVWVSWPKKASGVPTDITEDTIRSATLGLSSAAGLPRRPSCFPVSPAWPALPGAGLPAGPPLSFSARDAPRFLHSL